MDSKDVGVDIERIDENKADAIRYVLDEEEKKINDLPTLFKLWSNKESLIKCSSNGLKDIKRIKGLPLVGYRNINGEDYYTESLVYNGYSLSVSIKGNEPFNMKIINIEN